MLDRMSFVGRERELALLGGALQQAADGRPSRVLLSGSAGIGSSHLLDELVRRIGASSDVTVVRGVALAPSTFEPFAPLAAGLESTLSRLSDAQLRRVVDRAGHDIAALLPGLAERLAAARIDLDPPRLDAPDQLGSRVMEAVLGVIERSAEHSTLLLILEDLHLADAATRAFLGALLRSRRQVRICLVVSWRPDELPPLHPLRSVMAELAAASGAERLELAPLEADEVEQLITELLEGRPAGDLLAAVDAGSMGEPLLVSHLVAATASLEGIRLSMSFEDGVAARLDALSGAAAQAARLLAAARQPMERATLLRSKAMRTRLTATALAEVVASGLVIEDDDRVGIAHDRYADAIDQATLPWEREAFHAELAAMMVDRPARAAWHLDRTGDREAARRTRERAASMARRLDPGDTTLEHLSRALELATDGTGRPVTGGDGTDPGQLLLAAARAASASGMFRRGAGYLRTAIDLLGRDARSSSRDERRLMSASLREELGRTLRASGDLAGGIEVTERALELAPDGPSQVRARILCSLAQYLMLDGRFAESARLAQEAVDLADTARESPWPEMAHALCTLGVDLAYLGELDRGLALLEASAIAARKQGRLDDLMRAALNRTTLLDLDARRTQALDVVTVSVRDARSGGLERTYGAFLRGNAADILYQLGRWRECERECRAGMEWPPAGVAWFSPTLYLGLVLVESRADDEAATLMGQTLLQLETMPAGQWSALVQRAAVSHALWRGDHQDALHVAAREWPRVLETDETVQFALAAATCLEAAAEAAEAARSARDIPLLAEATRLAVSVLAEARDRVAASSMSSALGARQEAELLLATARAHEKRVNGRAYARTFARLAEAWQERGIPYLAAKCRWWQALGELRGSGGRDAAREPLHAAWRLASPLPAGPLCAALMDLASRSRLDLPIDDAYPAPPIPNLQPRAQDVRRVAVPVIDQIAVSASGAIADLVRPPEADGQPFGLSPRELEVLLILSEGRTDREIAERLFISQRTVHIHVRRVLAKLGASSRTQAASIAWRAGVVPGAPTTPTVR
jgi:DNA-binding CsgD family transcriptional regulator/tetratricopeptide (TPR) repeat protein